MNIKNPDHIRAAGSYHIHSAHSIMTSAKAYNHMENGEWEVVEDMLSQGSLRKADLEEQHGGRIGTIHKLLYALTCEQLTIVI